MLQSREVFSAEETSIERLNKHFALRCSSCNKVYDPDIHGRCIDCTGLLDPQYGPDAQVRETEVNPLRRYFDLLPISALPAAASWIVGNTPCYHSRQLGKLKHLDRFYIKDESDHVTHTTKDRMAILVIIQLMELGVKEFVASSTGNSSSALAYAVSQIGEGIRMHSFAGKEFVHRHDYHEHPQIILHEIDGTYVEASNRAKSFAISNGLVSEGGFFNYARREGLKLAYLEAYDAIPGGPDVVIQAISSGMGLYGGYRGMREYQRLGKLQKTPRFVCVQQDTCAPMVSAYQSGSHVIRPEDIVHSPQGLAHAILRGDPTQTYPFMLKIVTESGGCFVAVTTDEIVDAWSLVQHYHGIKADYAGAAAIAAAFKLRESGWINQEERVLVNLTGGMRPSSELSDQPKIVTEY
jgi:threonine synthase